MQTPETLPPPSGLLEWLKWVAVVGPLLLTAYVLVRQNTSKLWKEERDAALAKADRLEDENKKLSDEKVVADRELAECRAKTDLSTLMEMHRGFHLEVVGAITRVASGNDDRYDKTIAAFERYSRELNEGIVKRLDAQRESLNAHEGTLAALTQAVIALTEKAK